jgi:hypothetical protein
MFQAEKKMKVLRTRKLLKTAKSIMVDEDVDEMEGEATDLSDWSRPSLSRRSRENGSMFGEDGPDIHELYEKAKASKTFGEFREKLSHLLIGYILSEYSGFEARLFSASEDKESDLFVGVSARESVLRAHADLLKYRIRLDHDVSVDLLMGVDPKKREKTGEPMPMEFAKGEVVTPFIEFDVDEEEQYFFEVWKNAFQRVLRRVFGQVDLQE